MDGKIERWSFEKAETERERERESEWRDNRWAKKMSMTLVNILPQFKCIFSGLEFK